MFPFCLFAKEFFLLMIMIMIMTMMIMMTTMTIMMMMMMMMMMMGYPAYYHQSHSHQVGICHNDEGWEYDTVKFPPYTQIMMNITFGVTGQTNQVELL